MLIFAGTGICGDIIVTKDFDATNADGTVTYKDNGDWNTAHNASVGTGATTANTTINIYTGFGNTNVARMGRGFIPIDTSDITIDATIISATLYGVVSENQSPDNQCIMRNAYSVGSTITFYLNYYGINAIEKGGITKIGMSYQNDVLDTAPSTTWNYPVFPIHSSEATNTTYRPFLRVTYKYSPADYNGDTVIDVDDVKDKKADLLDEIDSKMDSWLTNEWWPEIE